VIGRSAHEGQSQGHIDAAMEVDRLDRDQRLVVIHAQRRIVVPPRLGVKHRVRRQRTARIDSRCSHLRDGRRDDVDLLATTANLVVRDDLHPALAYLLLEAARQVHKVPSLVNRPDEFPTPSATDFPLANEAERYFKSGRPFLQNYLPFWVANYVQRLVLLLIPLVAVVIPLANFLPRLVDWRRQARLNRRYGELKFQEAALASRQLTDAQRRDARLQLDRIETEIVRSKFPLELADRVYTLRQHLDYVRTQLERQPERR